jgi:GMP synthase-like glutamine amidotransferase
MQETMTPATKPQKSQTTPADWRLTPGYLNPGRSNFESVHVLLGRFLVDRHSENPLPEKSLLAENGTFDWGIGKPLEKVINSREDFEVLMKNPQLIRNSITIIEPWEHVGFNRLGEDVRASVNVAFIAQKIADCDSILLPAWSTGILDPEIIVPVITSGLAVIVEGGDPTLRDPSSFTQPACSLDDLYTLVDKLLLSRSPTSAPAIFICLGHQLAAACHVRLVKRAVKEVLSLESLERDRVGKALKSLQKVCKRIEEVGNSLQVKKKDGRVVAKNWDDPEFAVALNEIKEIGDRRLSHYQSPDSDTSGIPQELINAHEVTADEFEGVIDTTIEYERDVNIAMFHSDEVNEEAILLANWAYRLLHDAIIPYRHVLAGSSLSWLMQLPYAVEILCSTAVDEEIATECSATCINYKDFESKLIRRSFTCQFHPELFSDLRVIGIRQPPSYAKLKTDDGTRLFARLLYAGMQE